MSEHAHIVPVRIYLIIFGALMLLTALTVWVAFQHLGPLNDVVALGIASLKATLVVLFFMHAKYSSPVIKITLVAAVCFWLVLAAYVFADVASRGWLYQPGHEPII